MPAHHMMLALVLFAQLTAVADPVYSSERLRDLVARAAVANHAPPPELRGYRARVETEFSILLRDTLGRERAAQIEQLASKVEWTRNGRYDMHVIGYRSQSLGAPISTLSFVQGWTEPTLYGDRLLLGVQMGAPPDAKDAKRKTGGGNWIVAVHPFSYDRDRYYRFSGGDTVVVMRTASRSIPLVRVHVSPRLGDATRLAAFDGEIDLDADRQLIVRMRGQFVVLAAKGRPTLSPLPGLVGVAYCEFVNAEIDGRYWLPAFQRTELQSTFALLGQTRAVMRMVSHFSDHTIDRSDSVTVVEASRDTDHRTSWASSDSVSGYGDWTTTLGVATAGVNANDFDDVGPDVWKPTGRPRFDIAPTKTDNVIRYDRVEGFYTGIEASLRMRSAVPGLTIGGSVGWAWTERTARGGAHISLRRNQWTTGARVERMLASTNDFTPPLNPESGGLAAMFGSIDDFDYVDRRVALGSLTKIVGSPDNALVTFQLGAGGDRAEVARLEHGLAGGGSFRPNRGSTDGKYALGVVEAEVHPGVSGEFVQPGLGARVHYEVGRGALDWQRAELLLAGRKYLGPLALWLQADAGVVWGAVIPPQQLLEVGGSGTLSGYDYKEFAGDQAALVRGNVSYAIPIWRVPHRLWRTLFVPGVGPGIVAGLQGGWTALSTDTAQQAAVALATPFSTTPVARATGGFRATANFGLTFFNGSVHLGVARPIDHSAPWRFVGGLGSTF
ncbi:MAG TPA: hypothetical protein VD771_05925 [Gemmatimonadaceae bacterium]|nr:hypothetical protein [Gemmatimonadaceae bacterium]